MKEANYNYEEELHYDKRYQHEIKSIAKYHKDQNRIANEGALRASHRYWEKEVISHLNMNNIRILDYGCGSGLRSMKFLKDDMEFYGIDISSKSIEQAKKISSTGYYTNLIWDVMDCHQTNFPNNYFDIILDYGTFSSLDKNRAFPEICRILKPTGTIISIETLGHNPLINLKRKINLARGTRTKWAVNNIMKMEDWRKFSTNFQSTEMHYFGLLTIFISPFFFKSKITNFLLSLIESVDSKLLKIPIMKKFAFKTVVISKNPNKVKSNINQS